MPIYEYHCAKCQRDFEVEQRIVDDPIKTCPKCKSRRVKRLISRTSFVLKGGGWYSDLYASSKGKDDASASASDEGSSPKTGDKSDTKPAASSDSKDSSTPSKDSKSKKKDSGKGSKAVA